MTTTGILLSAAASAGTKAMTQLITSIYEKATGKTKKALRNWNNEDKIKRLFTQVGKLRKVKTLWQVDKAVDLTSFYCDSRVEIDDQRLLIRRLEDFGTTDNLLIEGIPGQGKSIFLRYLCAIELQIGNFIPVLIELRRLKRDDSLADHIVAALVGYGLDADGEVFSDLAKAGKLLILLDAFDELLPSERTRLIAEIEDLADSNLDCRVVVSSRPHSGFASSPLFHVAKLSNLQGAEFESLVYRLLPDSHLADQLIGQVKQHKRGIDHLLITPLLVTLLVLKYKSFQEVPEQLSEFYASLFDLLLQRHDGTKPGFKRSRQCELNDHQYREVFEALCYYCKEYGDGGLSYDQVYAATTKALEDLAFQEDPSDYLDDVVKITCLIVRDGEEYRFIHKSVSEYYCASFISHKPEVVSQDLYKQAFDDQCWVVFFGEFHFLEEMDRYRFYRFGVLDKIVELFGRVDIGSVGAPAPEHYARIQQVLRNATITQLRRDSNERRTPELYVGYPELGFLQMKLLVELRRFDQYARSNAVLRGLGFGFGLDRYELPVSTDTDEAVEISAKEVTDALFALARKSYEIIGQNEKKMILPGWKRKPERGVVPSLPKFPPCTPLTSVARDLPAD